MSQVLSKFGKMYLQIQNSFAIKCMTPSVAYNEKIKRSKTRMILQDQSHYIEVAHGDIFMEQKM